jgi:hypothetical protein
MVSMGALWLPILLSAVAVFVVTFLLWMASPHHRTDWRKLDDGRVAAALKEAGLAGGQYQINQGRDAAPGEPAGFLILFKSNMPRSLPLSFLHNIAVATAVAFIASWFLAPGSSFSEVFTALSVVAALGYTGPLPSQAIWFGRTWSSTLKEIFDGIVYGVVTAAVFAWLWPS